MVIETNYKRWLLVITVLACLYVTRHLSNMPSILKQNLTVSPTTNEKIKPLMDGLKYEKIKQLEQGFQSQVHPWLLKWLRSHWIIPPSAGPLNLSQPKRKHFSQYDQSAQTDDILHKKTNGFFVECGAWDGEALSNTLFFERERNWTGLLIESLKGPFQGLQTKHRNSFSINACLSITNTTGKAKFGLQGMTSGIAEKKFDTLTYKDYEAVQCFTLYSLMKALNRTRIDFFSLDVEGAELGILKTIPFQHLEIHLFLIEYAVHKGNSRQHQKRFVEIDTFLKSKGYELVKKTYQDVWYMKRKSN